MKRQKDILLKPELFAFYDHIGIAEHLEKMAAKGWELEKPGTFLWRYRRIEPQKQHIAVSYFAKASQFDPGPSEAQREWLDFAARDGWQPVAQWGQMQIFANAAENPTPLETEPVAQLENLRQAMRRSFIPGHVFLFAVLLYYVWFTVWQSRGDPVTFLSSNLMLGQTALFVLMGVALVYEVGCYLFWQRRARKAAAEQGVFLPLRTHRRFNTVILVLVAVIGLLAFADSGAFWPIMVLCFGGYLGILWLVNRARDDMKRADFSRGWNFALSLVLIALLSVVMVVGLVWIGLIIPGFGQRKGVGTWTSPGYYNHTFILYDDPLPLRMEDLTDFTIPEGSARTREARRSATFLLTFTQYRDWGYGDRAPGNLDYTVIDTDLPFLYDYIKQCRLAAHDQRDPEQLQDYLIPIDPTPWQAQEVYQRYWSSSLLDSYFIFWEGRMVALDLETPPTPEQIAIIVQALKPQ